MTGELFFCERHQVTASSTPAPLTAGCAQAMRIPLRECVREQRTSVIEVLDDETVARILAGEATPLSTPNERLPLSGQYACRDT